MRILVIEDEAQLARHVTRALIRNGHDAVAAGDGAQGLQLALENNPELIVLDLNLPTMDGFSVLNELRRSRCEARVIILTAKGEVESRVKGLRTGADDYLTKPFSMEELLARIDALGRRAVAPTRPDILEVGELRLDLHRRLATRRGKAIDLSPREFDVLQVLMQEPGRAFSRTELCERIWQRDHEYDSRTVEIFIARLRKKIDEGFSDTLIQTVRSVGYRLSPPDGHEQKAA